jgi:shikimate dehydrogenase
MAAIRTGLIGWPVAHSLSPVIHRHWLNHYGIEGSYELFPIDPANMEPEIKKLKALGVRGFNVTVPHKETIIPFLDTVDEAAHRIGAVNTVIRDGQTWRGTNTDAYGFMAHLKESLKPSPSGSSRGSSQTMDFRDKRENDAWLEKIVILGAGGAARAVIAALKEAGAKHILILNRTKATADALAAEFGVKAGEWEARDEAVQKATLLVNTTSLGMKGHPPLDVDLKNLAEGAAVYDIVYAPLETALLKSARSLRLIAVDGLGMLLYQAQLAFKEWHGILPEVNGELRALVLAEIGKRDGA